MKYIVENRKLSALIDMDSRPVRALVRSVNKDYTEVVRILSDAYDKALATQKITCDSDGISFETEFALCTLSHNLDWGDGFDYYLRFSLKEDYVADEYLCEELEGETEETVEKAEDVTACPPEKADELIIPKASLIRLNKFVNGVEGEANADLVERLKHAYEHARENLSFAPHGESSLAFDTGLQTFRGEVIKAALKPVGETDDRWVLHYVGYESASAFSFARSALSGFANMGAKWLTDIESIAKKEKWYFGDETGNPVILQNYIAYTFYRIMKEDKLCINKTNDFAVFNTGLASSTYDDIYMCFKRNDAEEKWRYEGVCTSMGGYLMNKVISSFGERPKPAQYFCRREDIIMDRERPIFPDFEHIILERLHRIPTAFLRKHLSSCDEALQIIDKIEGSTESTEYLYSELKEMIKEREGLFETVRSGLENVISKARNRSRWNYRLAIPCYYPKGNSMSFLLPLDFLNDGTVQSALVVQTAESGNYIGHTLLNMRNAYLDARLISSQESSWLIA